MRRLFYFIILLLVTTLNLIGPFPITELMLIWVVLFRPKWFYKLILKIYDKQ